MNRHFATWLLLAAGMALTACETVSPNVLEKNALSSELRNDGRRAVSHWLPDAHHFSSARKNYRRSVLPRADNQSERGPTHRTRLHNTILELAESPDQSYPHVDQRCTWRCACHHPRHSRSRSRTGTLRHGDELGQEGIGPRTAGPGETVGCFLKYRYPIPFNSMRFEMRYTQLTPSLRCPS
jgi:hypothetical protein